MTTTTKDKEIASVPEAARAAYTCIHHFQLADPLNTGSIAVYCSKCGTTAEGNKIIPPVAYASGIKPQPEKTDWKKDFEEKHWGAMFESGDYDKLLIDISNLLLTERQKLRQEILGIVEGMKIKRPVISEDTPRVVGGIDWKVGDRLYTDLTEGQEGHNNALSTLAEKLKQL